MNFANPFIARSVLYSTKSSGQSMLFSNCEITLFFELEMYKCPAWDHWPILCSQFLFGLPHFHHPWSWFKNFMCLPSCRFHMVAYLQQIWWFEVGGELEFPFPAGTYSLFFRVLLGRPTRRLGRRVCNPEHIHGWNIKPVWFRLTTSDGQHSISPCHLENNPGSWANYHAGDFVVESHPDSFTKIKFSMAQIDCTHTKGGLCLDSVLVCPSSIGKSIIDSSA